jgi:hypothetical protein
LLGKCRIGEESYSGALKRLWGGKYHYCLSFVNLFMTGISACMVFLLLFGYLLYLEAGGFFHVIPYIIGYALGVISGVLYFFL